jgi:hypothetical protein
MAKPRLSRKTTEKRTLKVARLGLLSSCKKYQVYFRVFVEIRHFAFLSFLFPIVGYLTVLIFSICTGSIRGSLRAKIFDR